MGTFPGEREEPTSHGHEHRQARGPGQTSFSKQVRDEAPNRPGVVVSFQPAEVNGESRSPPVDEITFDTDLAVGGRVEVAAVEERPPPEAVGDDVESVVRTFEVTTPAGLQGTPAALTFTVSQAELGGRDPANVRLARRLQDGSWKRYEATPVDPTADPIRFRADVPGFSTWSVFLHRSSTVTETPTATDGPTETPTPTVTPTPSPTRTTTNPPTGTTSGTADESATTDTPSGQPGFGIGIALVAVLSAGLVKRRRSG